MAIVEMDFARGVQDDMTFEYYATAPSTLVSFKPKGNWAVSYSWSGTTVLQYHTTDMGSNELTDIRNGVKSSAAITTAGYTIGTDGTISRNDYFTGDSNICIMYQAN